MEQKISLKTIFADKRFYFVFDKKQGSTQVRYEGKTQIFFLYFRLSTELFCHKNSWFKLFSNTKSALQMLPKTCTFTKV